MIMSLKNEELDSLAKLRRRAEDKQKAFPQQAELSCADADREKLIQEMHIHQIELEMQNGELVKLRNDAEVLAEKYIDVYDFSPVSYLSLNSLGFVVMANLTAARQFATNRTDLIGKHFCQLITEGSQATFNDFFKEVFRTGSPATCELTLNIPEQQPRIVRVRANISPSGDECRLALMDITERKRAEEALEKQRRQLEDVNRELESFTYSVSHDLQAPLRAIEGFSRMILKRQGEHFDEETRRKFEVIMANVKQMERLIADLLTFSRLERRNMSMTMVNVSALIREAWEEILVINPGRKLTLKLSEVPPCFGDRALLKQVIANILGNAVKFSGSREETVVEVGAQVQKEEPVYYIRDNGVGFDMAYYDRLFAIFKTLHDREEYKGTGVGLALAQRIINRHSGRIWAESKLGEGSIFYFSLPAAHA